ncbi:MAG: glucosyl-3-phosphoglycerate synthase [Actinomycetota bacterium]|nr:glucosyl-3-phosphoglycerate synthase [Actinomycetota bacterium]MDQ3648544.1 glucosyl-3-phosphoglycerate synthase [Actinomycetota bacterium]
MIRRFHHSAYPAELLRELKREAVTVVLPTREVADTIGPIVETLTALELIDQVLVIDAASEDGSGELARSLGAEVHKESELVPSLGPAVGKGDAMWRALSVARGDIVIYMDSDTRGFRAHFVCGMLGPLLVDEGVAFLKGAFQRPFAGDPDDRPPGGGRVTELTARPLFSAFYPELAAFVQPLAGEVAARRALFERLPFACGYAIETSMLLHARDEVGIERMAQVDLDERHNHHQSLEQLRPMSYAVLRVVLERLRREGRLLDDHAPPLQTADGRLVQVELVERPPYASLRAGV